MFYPISVFAFFVLYQETIYVRLSEAKENTYTFLFVFKKVKVCVVWLIRTGVPWSCGLPPVPLDQV